MTDENRLGRDQSTSEQAETPGTGDLTAEIIATLRADTDSTDPSTARDETGAISVGIADYALTDDETPLKTSGLGSCIGVAIHDDHAGVSGLLHFMLPAAADTNGTHPDAKFADTGFESMLKSFRDLGGTPARSWAKIAGGAAMLDTQLTATIGERNINAITAELEAARIQIRETDVGGYHGRSLEFDPATGTLTVSSANGDVRRL
ncbi:hypothetical protein C482_20331 [Natrialba chahannaoensis JCM 10990]|uniref:Probable chemoreceptor glutamine deamidase CheD n=1 Tax=Natrialba chahannaoensis JCM 10990 TaxID=1227492 RepID=M0A3A5_9EURY|nr:chemotaxis protein CheD [Natrialba chahannaoensis]ELY93059.1 hypothetical protein C482_20331 [Natrialba chahannaoensis JCM 10990]